eukprot:7385673-Prymnesium_polylepis.4
MLVHTLLHATPAFSPTRLPLSTPLRVASRAALMSDMAPASYAYATEALKAAGIDIAANDFTAMVYFRGSW